MDRGVIFETLLRHKGTGSHDANHFTIDDALGLGGILHLFTDGDPMSRLNQPLYVGIHTLDRDSGHGNFLTAFVL